MVTRVKDVMRRPTAPLIHVDHPLDEAVARMHAERETFAPVVDGDRIVGILDIGRFVAFPRKGAHDRCRLSVRDRMTNAVPFLYEDDPLPFAHAVARATGHQHFCVLDENRRLSGLLSFAGPHAVQLDWKVRTLEIDERTARRTIVVTATSTVPSPQDEPGVHADRPVLDTSIRPPDDSSG